MSINWKPVAVSTLLAFTVAVVSAGIGGVPFGVLLLRAVLGAIIFGAGAVGVQYLVQKFLPELSGETFDGDSTSELEAGGSVDIVISDDEDADQEDAVEQVGSEESLVIPDYQNAASDTSADDESPEFRPGMRAAAVSDSEDGEPLVEEVHEGAVDSGEEPIPPDEDESSADQDVGADSAGLDALPDVGAFSGSFMADSVNEELSHESSGPRSDGQDPESIAKAIRTLMKREDS